MTTSSSELQSQLLAIIPKFTAAVSIPSSMFIVKEVIQDHRMKRGTPSQRALLGMSVVDIMASSGWWLSTWAVPKDSGIDVAFASGNTASCNYQGWLLQVAIGAPLYNGSLALLYLLVIRYRYTNTQLMKLERWIHGAILLFSFGTGFALLPLGQYNHINTVCWIVGSPPDCGNSSYQPGDVPCERGDWAWLYGLLLFYVPLWICILFTSLSMLLIYMQVQKTEQRNQKYSFGRTTNASGRTMKLDPKTVATQAVLYTSAFIITWLPSTIWSIAHWFGFSSFWLDFAAAVCEPLQGWWNFLIFIRRRRDLRQKLRSYYKSIVRCVSAKTLFFGGGTASTVSSATEVELDQFGEDMVKPVDLTSNQEDNIVQHHPASPVEDEPFRLAGAQDKKSLFVEDHCEYFDISDSYKIEDDRSELEPSGNQ